MTKIVVNQSIICNSRRTWWTSTNGRNQKPLGGPEEYLNNPDHVTGKVVQNLATFAFSLAAGRMQITTLHSKKISLWCDEWVISRSNMQACSREEGRFPSKKGGFWPATRAKKGGSGSRKPGFFAGWLHSLTQANHRIDHILYNSGRKSVKSVKPGLGKSWSLGTLTLEYLGLAGMTRHR